MSHMAYFIAHNAYSADVMPHGVAHVANPDDITCGLWNMCVLASQASLCNSDVPKSTY